MKLTVIGCAGSFPGPTSPSSCYLVEHDGTRILLDMGNGSLGALANYIDIYDVDAIALSHLHIDHCADLASFYVARRYRRPDPARVIPVYGPVGSAARMAAVYGLNEHPGMTEEFDFHEYVAGESAQLGAFTITPSPTVHVVDSYAIRVEAGGKVLAYSGDTGPCGALVDSAQGADLALFEASYLDRLDNPRGMHLTGGDATKAARDAEAGRLILTHLVAWNDSQEVLADAKAVGGIDIELARPGLTVEI